MTKDLFEESLEDPIDYWCNKSKEEVFELLGSDVAMMVNYNQCNPHHCYDLFLHTLYTVEDLKNDASIELKIAAFFHDIGKTYVAMHKDGRIVFYGHAQKSSEIAKGILYDLGYNMTDVEHICFYIEHHDDFISWVLLSDKYDKKNPYLTEITVDNVISYIKRVQVDNRIFKNKDVSDILMDLVSLCKADAKAQSEYVYSGDKVVDSREHKLNKIVEIENIMKKYIDKVE